MTILAFMAKRDWRFPNFEEDYKWINELFRDSDKYIYFIQDEITFTYLDSQGKWVTDRMKALSFKNKMKAKTYAIEKKLSGWVIMEQEII